ncbi:MAG: DUF5693 family protein [Bacillota bacterium]|nr:DUF5693 family protein [Bacillota bacterium]
MPSDKLVSYILVGILLLSVFAAGYAGYFFHASAKDARDLEITVRLSDVEIFASRAGLTVEEALSYLKEQGVTSIGVSEYYLWKLRRDPGHYVLSNLELVGEMALNPELSYYRGFLEETISETGLSFGDYIVFMPQGPWAEQVGEHLNELYAIEQPGIFSLESRSYDNMILYLIKGARYENLPHLSLGAKPSELEQIAGAGLFINPYLSQRKIENDATIEQMLSTYDGFPLSAAVFEGGTVPGYPRFLAGTADALRQRSIPGVIYEYHLFPKGMERVAPLLDYNLAVMRPHRADQPPHAALNSIMERRVQMVELQVRDLFPRLGGEELRDRLSSHMVLLTGELERNGFTPGKVSPLVPPQLPLSLYLIMAAGVLAVSLLMLRIFFTWKNYHSLWLFVLGILGVFLLFKWNFLFTQQGLSLAAAVLFPLYAALLFFFLPSAEKGGDRSPQDGASALALAAHMDMGLLWRSLGRIFLVFLISLAGGLLVHGLLTTPPFFHGMELFRGVKMMYTIPLALAALMAFTIQGFSESEAYRGNPGEAFYRLEPSGEQKHAFYVFLRRLLRRPVTLGDLILIGVLLLGGLFYLTRTGHVMEITAAEGAVRGFLDYTLGVRPRFKEFAIGYPLAFLGLYLLGSSGGTVIRRLAFCFLLVGTLVPISVVNTFAHITAPVSLSLLRSFHGFWLGCIGGFFILFIWKRVALLLLLHKLYIRMKQEQKNGQGEK